IDDAACTGTAGVCIIGDTITFEWDNSAATGDNNTDITLTSQVTFDLTAFGGSATQTPDSVVSDVFSYDLTLGSGSVDASGLTFTATATDGFTNTTTSAASTDTTSVDNEAPVISVAGVITLSNDVQSDGLASIGDDITYTAGTVSSADSDAWTVDLSTYNLSATESPGAITIVADNDDGAISATETLTDNAGNTASGSATISGFTDIDNLAPTGLTALSAGATGTTTQVLNWSEVTETSFDHYEIWYGTNQGDVQGRTGTAVEWDDTDDANLATKATTTTTITGLSASTTYYFKIWAQDDALNEETVTDINTTTNSGNTAPTGTFNSATQKTDGSGDVDLSIEVDDTDDDDTKAKVEYETDSDGNCNGPWAAATLLGPATADFDDSGGAPSITATTYQVGDTATTRIITSSGSNTVDFDWDSATDLPTADGTQCLRLTVNDDALDQSTPDTQTVTVDNTDPTVSAGNISVAATGSGTAGAFIIGDTVTVTWDNSAGGDNNTDLNTATADLSDWGGGSSIAMTDTTDCGGSLGDGIYEACYTISAGSEDTASAEATVTATDTSGNQTGPTADGTTYTADNIAPVISVAGVITLSNDVQSDGIASIGDDITYAAGTVSSADGDAWTADLSAYNLSATESPGAITIVADNDDGAISATETLTDNAGNTASGSVTITGFTDIDNLAPSGLTALTAGTTGTTTQVLNWTEVTETSFDHYEIWYGTNQSDVQNRTGTAVEWDNTDDANLATKATTTTTITGLSASTTYYFKIWAQDDAFNEETVTDINTTTNAANNAPVTSAVTGVQQADDGYVNVTYTLTDADDDTCSLVTYEYSLTGVFGGEEATMTAAGGDGAHSGTTGLLCDSDGENYTFVWDAKTDEDGTLDSTVYVRIQANDATTDGNTDTSASFALDVQDPTITAGNLNIDDAACTGTAGVCIIGDTITFEWDNSAATGDNNTDITLTSQVTFDLSAFGGSASQTPDSVTSDVFSYDLTLGSGSVDASGLTFTATATDGFTNTTTSATSTDTTSVDNEAPIISVAGVITLSNDVDFDGIASIGDDVTYASGTVDSADGDAWTVDLSAYNLSATESPGAITVVADNDDGAISATETLTDNAGNTASGSATISGFTDIDNLAPSGLTALTAGATGVNDQVLNWTAVTETSFDHYEIWYGTNQSDVQNRTGGSVQWDDTDDINLATRTTTTTTVTGLNPSTTYYFKIFAQDDAANEETVSDINTTTSAGNTPPTGLYNSATQKTDGSGVVDLSIEVDDADDDDTKAKVEYETDSDGNCNGPWAAATLSGPATADFSDSGGAPSVTTDTYQVGTTATYRIITSSGSNTVDFDWDSATDLPTASGAQCLRLTVNDDSTDQTTPDTQTVTVDNTDPVISTITTSPSSGTSGVGDPIIITLTAGETGLSVGTCTVNGVDVSGTFVDNTDNTYTITYTVGEGETDWTSGNLPISCTLEDSSGNSDTGSAFTDSNTLAGDANTPSVSTTTVSPSSGTAQVGDPISVIITAGETGLLAGACTVNGVDVSGTLVDNTDNTYTITYTVGEGETDWTAGNLPINCTLIDAGGNGDTTTAFTDSNTLAGDANSPIISTTTVSPSSGTSGVGDPITITLTDGETGLSIGACTVNGVDVSGTLVDNTDNTYTITYTVGEGETDWTAGNLPISCILEDSAGNSDTTTAFTDSNTLAGDANTPTGLTALVAGATGVNNQVLNWTAVTESNFNHYEIWFGTNQSDVQNRTGTAVEWDDTDDSNLATRTTTTTTITGLNPSTTYYFKIWAVDDADNEETVTDINTTTSAGNSPPTVTTPSSITQATDTSGYITFQTTVADVNLDTTRLKVEYSDDGGSTFYDPDLVSATPSAGTVDLNDANPYQIGTVDAIDTDGGSVVLTIVWDTKSIGNGNGAITGEEADIQIKVTANDSVADSTPATSTDFVVDNQAPTGLGSFAAGSSTTSSQVLTWDAVTDGNFDHYEIWFGTNQSDVQNRIGTASEWDDGNDGGLANIGETSTTITSLSSSTTYYYKIWAVDIGGNEMTVPDLSKATAAPSGGGGGGGGGGSTPLPTSPTCAEISVLSLKINGNMSITESREVVIDISQVNATEVILSEDSNFTDAQYQFVSTEIPFTLHANGNGIRTVYARFRNDCDVSGTVSDMIVLSSPELVTPEEPEIEIPPEEIPEVEPTEPEAPEEPEPVRLLPRVIVYRDINFQGPSETYYVGQESNDLRNSLLGNDQISSVQILDGAVVTLYEHILFGGKSEVLINSDPNLADNYIGDSIASSLRTVRTAEPSTNCEINSPFISELSVGQFGAEVTTLQGLLKCIGTFPSVITPTAYFGTITVDALKEFQAQNGLVPTGVLDAPTRQLLNQYVKELVIPPPVVAAPETIRSENVVVLFEDINYGGRSETLALGSDISDFRSRTIGNDTVSSFKIIGEAVVQTFEHINFLGRSEVFETSAPDLRNSTIGDNILSSLRIFAKKFGFTSDEQIPTTEEQLPDVPLGGGVIGVTAYEHVNFQGLSQTFLVGDELDLSDELIKDNNISSFRLFGGATLEVYTEPFLSGASETILFDDSDLRNNFIGNDTISSLRVIGPADEKFVRLAGCRAPITFTSYLTFDSTGPEVVVLQDVLKCLGFFPPNVDSTGYFGEVTLNAVREFQAFNGLFPFGIVGPQTRAALNNM
ncbi:peptidoglycan-binding protein, partial [Patescibacteria group bacterium]